MPPKEGKKGGKKLLALAQLNALQTTFKAACRQHGVPLHKGIAGQIADAIQEGGSISKITFTGPDIGPGYVKAAADLMAGYTAVKNLACYGCSLADEGLLTIAQLLRASSDKWWKGSKIKLLEIVNDGMGIPLEKWPERYMEHMRGGLDTLGPGHAMPSLLMEEAEAVTPHTLQLHREGLPVATATTLATDLTRACQVTGTPLTSLAYTSLAEAKTNEQEQARQGAASGYLPCAPARWSGPPPPKPTISTQPEESTPTRPTEPAGAPALTQVGSLARPEGMAMMNSSSGMSSSNSLMPEQELGLPPLGDGSALSRQVSSQRSPSPHLTPSDSMQAKVTQHQPYQKSRLGGVTGGGAQPAEPASPAPTDKQSLTHALAYPPAPARPSFALAAAAPDFLARHSLDPMKPMAFSQPALQQLSLGLGVKGITLQVLVLDHNQLGDLGALTLASGLSKCASLKQLSLSDCGIGPVGAAALSDALTPGLMPEAAALSPKLTILSLSRNPLMGAGLSALCPGLAACTTLKVLHLSSVGLTEGDVPALGALSDALAANVSINQVDLDANFFGDAGAAAFIPFLTGAKHIKKFRITARGMTKAVGGQVVELVRANLPKKKVVKKKAVKK